MSNAILEMSWPARGGAVANGSFEQTLWSDGGWTAWSAVAGYTVEKYGSAPDPPHGDYTLKVIRDSGTGSIYIRQFFTAGYVTSLPGKTVTFMGRIYSNKPVQIRVTTQTGTPDILSLITTGNTIWEYVRVTGVIDSAATSLRFQIVLKSAAASDYMYCDAMSLVLGDTYGRVEIDQCHVFPEPNPEQVPSGSVTLADGGIAGVEDSLVIINKEYTFKGITDALYKKLRNFQRYVCCGKAYEFDYTDIDGEAYKARMLPSFADSVRIGPDRWNTTMNLRLTDKGIA